jgi:hypothetical protein
MSRDVRTTCAVCAWRGECTKKFKNTSDAMHCPDYCRDVKFPPDEEEVDGENKPSRDHKKRVDPFAD